MKEKLCPKCNSSMEKGFIADKADFGHQNRQNWGTAVNVLGTGMVHALPVTTYRCVVCGYLESYTE